MFLPLSYPLIHILYFHVLPHFFLLLEISTLRLPILELFLHKSYALRQSLLCPIIFATRAISNSIAISTKMDDKACMAHIKRFDPSSSSRCEQGS